ncbi:RRM_1 domain-containing protein [Cephalotus follicularis]|uniref:RRM_1 domain-containing protein n=1 Tax=Cephalotus follicularis TaxID=3775 RepID=A0A1Q3B8Q8_CEPFO|nr:RRM_1 domain-containing protein [Cephalotus follicularis]
MAFFSKVGNILKQTATKQIGADLSASRPSIFQAIRCMSSSKLFIGGLSYSTDEQSLNEAFSKYGEVVEARVILDRETGRSRGFGFITFTSTEEASSAIQALDGQDLHGRRVRVNYATERSRSPYGSPYGQSGYSPQNTGGNYGGNDGGGYGGPGGNYGGNAGYGGGNYSGGGGNYGSNYGGGSGGNYGGNTYGGDTGAYNSSSGSYGVAGGSGGNDGYAGNSPAGGFEASTGTGYGSGDPLGGFKSSGMDDQGEDSYRDDDTDDFAKRA